MFDISKRRELLKKSGVLALGMMAFPAWMPRVAFRANQTATKNPILVVIFMRGGADALNIIVPHGDHDYYAHRSALAIKQPNAQNEDSAIDLDGYFGLHPQLRPLKELWDQRALAAVHAVCSPDPTHSHFAAMDYLERGTPGENSMQTGCVGRELRVKASEDEAPNRAVGVGTSVQQSLRGPI